MSILRNIIILVLISISNEIISQSFDLEKYNYEKEKILNKVINSIQFDSVYFSKRVFFEENELLTRETPIKLKKHKTKVRICKEDRLRDRQFLVLGDLTMARSQPKKARVQLEILPQKSLFNITLEKINNDWVIIDHIIFFGILD